MPLLRIPLEAGSGRKPVGQDVHSHVHLAFRIMIGSGRRRQEETSVKRLLRGCAALIPVTLALILIPSLATAQAEAVGACVLMADGLQFYRAPSCSIRSENPPQVSKGLLGNISVPGPTVLEVTFSGLLSSSFEMWAWQEAVRTNKSEVYKKSVTLVIFEPPESGGEPIARWYLVNAWPSGIKVNAVGLILSESVVLTADTIQRVAP